MNDICQDKRKVDIQDRLKQISILADILNEVVQLLIGNISHLINDLEGMKK